MRHVLFRKAFFASVLLGVCGFAPQIRFDASMAAETRDTGAKSSGNHTVQDMLIRESTGVAVDRAALLNTMGSSSTSGLSQDSSAMWHSGFAMLREGWKDIESLSADAMASNVRDYLKIRGELAASVESHTRLARYCKEHAMPDRANAHWFGVLELDNSNLEARSALGFQWIGNRWVSKEEMDRLVQSNAEFSAANKKWQSKVRAWVASIEGTDTKKRTAAIKQLKAVEDPQIVFAIQSVLPGMSETTSAHLVQCLKKFQTKEACLALLSISLTTFPSTTSDGAIEALKSVPAEFYIPELLDLMTSEIEIEDRLVTRPNGTLTLQLIRSRETKNFHEVSQMDKLLLRLPANELSANGTRSNINPVAFSVHQSEAKRLQSQTKQEILEVNNNIRALQNNAAGILRKISGRDLQDDPKNWWAWWEQRQESLAVGPKQSNRTFFEDSSSLVSLPVYREQVVITPPFECFVAGTRVQTEFGLAAIDEIRVGDRVVSQDIQTGELSLKPVLRTTVRPPSRTQNIVFGSGESVQCTLGHPFWVIGQGWVRAKDLEKEMKLRTAKGFVEISSIEPADLATTYNLAIADHNTYFAGDDRILSFDANEIVPTFQKAPGLAAEVVRK